MSRVWNDLQALQRKLAARQADSGSLPMTDIVKKVPPMGSAYSEYPPLDRAGLRDGYKKCVKNATRLVSGARALRDAGQCGSAYLILALALEELGAAIQLYEAGRSGVKDWEAWWGRYFAHPKKLESRVLDLPRMEDPDERFAVVRDELLYVDFDLDSDRFIAPGEDDDRDLRELLGRQVAYADAMLKALPSHAFERWEVKDLVAQSPDIAPSVLYARIEELLGQEPAVSERDLLSVIARDLGKRPDDFAVGYERWKKVAPKARVYMGLLQRVQGKLEKEPDTKGTG